MANKIRRTATRVTSHRFNHRVARSGVASCALFVVVIFLGMAAARAGPSTVGWGPEWIGPD
jgi:hypothetical protein